MFLRQLKIFFLVSIVPNAINDVPAIASPNTIPIPEIPAKIYPLVKAKAANKSPRANPNPPPILQCSSENKLVI